MEKSETSEFLKKELPVATVKQPNRYGTKSCQPEFIQFLANKKAFLVIFCLTCVLQGTFHTYFVAVITTLEKLFNIPSQTIGTLMMASEIGQVSSALFLPYYAGQGDRPRWMGFGSALFSMATLLCSSPHILIPPDIQQIKSTTTQFCSTEFNSTCSENFSETTATKYYLFGIIFLSLLCIGFGQTAIFTLGIPYLDDNVANKDSPVYFSITIGVRILGPVMGFVLGSLCTRLYIYPLSPPDDLTPIDPRWLGAWWLGMIIISTLLLVTSFFMLMFPKQLVNSSPQPKQNRSLKNFPQALKRLLGNRILVLRTFSSVFHLLPISGLYTFLPKYLESQFRLAAFQAAMVTGIAGILVMGIGIFASGLFIRRKEPSAKFVAIWVAMSALIYSIGIFSLIFIGCSGSDGYVLDDSDNSFNKPACSTTQCDSCSGREYSPVCADDRIYFSACHAGCNGTLNNEDEFVSCDCAENKVAKAGVCSLDCGAFPFYLAVFMVIVLVHSTSEVGSMLLTLRCVEPRDKAMALGLIQCAIGLFGNVPCPVIYGAVVDRACVIWGQADCDGTRGNCWVYDSWKFRGLFHGLTALLMFIAFVIDLVIVAKADKIRFQDDVAESVQMNNLNERQDS